MLISDEIDLLEEEWLMVQKKLGTISWVDESKCTSGRESKREDNAFSSMLEEKD